MLHVLDIRDAMESERFLQVHFEPISVDTSSLVNNTKSLKPISDASKSLDNEEGIIQ